VKDWKLVEIFDDVGGGEERWLLVFEVPTEFAPDGRWCSSFPKTIVNDVAGVYHMDIDSDEHLEEMIDHVLFHPCVDVIERVRNRWRGVPSWHTKARGAAAADVRAFKTGRLHGDSVDLTTVRADLKRRFNDTHVHEVRTTWAHLVARGEIR
jgi:hypothetical protein